MIRVNDPKNDPVLLTQCSRDVPAHLILNRLRDEGIDSFIDNSIFASVLPIGFNSIGALRIMVREADLERARRILDEMDLDN